MSKIIKLEDGQLVAEDPDTGERVPVSFEALEAESLVVDDQPSQDHRELLAYINEDGISNFSQTIENVPRENDQYVCVEVGRFWEEDGSTNSELFLEGSGIPDGDYSYLLEDEQGSNTHRPSENEFSLIETTATNTGDMHGGEWKIFHSGGRMSIFGNGAPGRRQQGRYMVRGGIDGTADDPYDLTLSADGVDLRLDIAVWLVKRRSEI